MVCVRSAVSAQCDAASPGAAASAAAGSGARVRLAALSVLRRRDAAVRDAVRACACISVRISTQPALTAGDALAAASTPRCTVAQRRGHAPSASGMQGECVTLHSRFSPLPARSACTMQVSTRRRHLMSAARHAAGEHAPFFRYRRVVDACASTWPPMGCAGASRRGVSQAAARCFPVRAQQPKRLLVVRAREGHAARVRHDLRRRAARSISMRAEERGRHAQAAHLVGDDDGHVELVRNLLQPVHEQPQLPRRRGGARRQHAPGADWQAALVGTARVTSAPRTFCWRSDSSPRPWNSARKGTMSESMMSSCVERKRSAASVLSTRADSGGGIGAAAACVPHLEGLLRELRRNLWGELQAASRQPAGSLRNDAAAKHASSTARKRAPPPACPAARPRCTRAQR